MAFEPHGAFAEVGRGDTTFVSIAQTWNVECARIYQRFIRPKLKDVAHLTHYIVINAKDWALETPEAGELLRQLFSEMAASLKKVYIAYIVDSDIKEYFIKQRSENPPANLEFSVHETFDEAVEWFASYGITLDMKEADLPDPVDSRLYLS